MKIKVYKNRQVVLETNDAGTQYENLAETLLIELPEYVEKGEEIIATSSLNKYIVFDIEGDENTDLIIDNKYSIPYAITQLGKVVAFIQLKEHTDNDDMTDKLIWISDGFPLTFDKSIETNIEITQEKVDAFNTLYTELNLRILEVTQLKLWIEQFQRDVAAGLYDGRGIARISKTSTSGLVDTYTIDYTDGTESTYIVTNGYTPVKGIDYFTAEEIQQIINDSITQFLQNDTFVQLQNNVSEIREELDSNTMLIIENDNEEE